MTERDKQPGINPQQVVLSPEEKEAIDEGLKSVAEEKTISHEDVMNMVKLQFPALFNTP